MNSISAFLLAFSLMFFLSCDNTGEPPESENKLYIDIKNSDGAGVEDVGLHFYSNINHFQFKTPKTGSPSAGIDSTDSTMVPQVYKLYQNYPNPFNPQTNIKFSLPVSGKVTLRILNRIDSQIIRTLIDRDLPAGLHIVTWDGLNDEQIFVSNNLYHYQLSSGEFSDSKQLFLNMVDPEHIHSLDCIPLAKSDAEGKLEVDYNIFPIGEEVVWVDEIGNELGTFVIPDSLQLVLIKDGYKPVTRSAVIDPSMILEMENL